MRRLTNLLGRGLSAWKSARGLDSLAAGVGAKPSGINAAGKLFMAHHTGFTLRTLVEAVRCAGFRAVADRSRNAFLGWWLVASKALLPEDEISRLAETHLPPQ